MTRDGNGSYIRHMKKQMISTKEAAALLGVSDATIVNWIHEGVFPGAIKLNPAKRNSPIKIPRSDVVAAGKKQRVRVARK